MSDSWNPAPQKKTPEGPWSSRAGGVRLWLPSAVTRSQPWERPHGGECSFLCFSLIYPRSLHPGDLILWSF